jgi:hypothetical protein
VPEDLAKTRLGIPHHLAYLVEDIEETVGRLVDQRGAGPFFHIERVPLENVQSRGEPAEFVHHSAFGYCGDGAIELVQPIALAPERVENRFAAPRPRVHHLGYVVSPEEVADLRSSLDERGVPEYLRSEFGGAVTTLHDASSCLGHDLEIHAENDGLRGFFDMVRSAAVDWDGSQRIRTVEL